MRIKLNERLVYVRPDGQHYPLHAPPDRVVMQSEGFGTPPISYQTTKAPFQNGATVQSFTLQPRPVQLIIKQNFCSRPDYWEGRATLLDEIRPTRVTDFNNTGKLLYYLSGGQIRQLDVLLDSGPGFAPSEGGWREWSFTEALRFVANNPIWYDPTAHTQLFSAPTGQLVFPITFPIVFSGFGEVVNITYPGTWEEYPTFVVTGPLTALSIENITTGKSIVLAYDLPAGMTATIVLNGIKSITRSDGLNLLKYLTPDSDLTTFSLAPDPVAPGGVNQLRISGTASSSPSSSVVMYWYTRYFGI